MNWIKRTAPRASLLSFLLIGACSPTCEEKIVQEVMSPDGANKAVVYSSLCGFNIDYNTQVSILRASEVAEGRSNVFGSNATGAETARGPFGGPVVSARWLGSRTLEISYDPAGSEVRTHERYKDFTIRYRTLAAEELR